MKIVLDTNVVVSGLLKSQGNPVQVLTLALAGVLQVCHDELILANTPKFSPVRASTLIPSECAKGWPSLTLTVWPLMPAGIPIWICPTRMMNRFWQSRWQPRRIFW